ncbi:serine/arginine-rich splicing factor SR34B isoform X2 [Brachypodium distachyon]|uniref:serine/arginine-rich splicing factor SR34B isoform X2 n=1 Tax=Brachypodium distachyon TaxID=15368 RepID=UPI000D0DD052|nr:serine/arginine-rich splicing factor SR34B isoform X2 [Brachypodium distachyon]|eukprot:XP_024314291.1 serine/arginine-rich splicing factor SR34B isoform X2 [Brachypodium distachyon]
MWLPSYMGDARGFAQVWPYIGYRLEIPPRRPVYAFVEVELAHGGTGPSFDRLRSYSSSGRREAARHSNYRVMVTGLPSSASWQDLKVITCGELVMSVSLTCIVRLEFSSESFQFLFCSLSCSYGYWITFFSIMARSQGSHAASW